MASDLPLVARDRELSAVTALIESVADGHGQGVLITGEAGIGKTRLLREARGPRPNNEGCWSSPAEQSNPAAPTDRW